MKRVDSEKAALYSIGELARRSGVPVKTIRYYSDVGVLPPSGVTEAGYRMYSEADRARLELIRTLRAAGFRLSDIAAMLEGKSETPDALRLQLETVDLQLRNLRRRRRLIKSALEDNEAVAKQSYPDRVHALGLLEAREREAFLAEHLEKGLEGTLVDPEAKAGFWRAIVSGMPEELDDAQLAAWTELAKLASDESFVEALREQTKPISESAEGDFDPSGWNGAIAAAFEEAKRAVREGSPPTGESGQRAIREWIGASAWAVGRQDDAQILGVAALPLRADVRSAYGALLGAGRHSEAMAV
ncbi:MAG: Transcriptional regulator, MerR family [uncultured Rubrobacteraceae bacterium]|uniref:Transcriptional regulator, MerR family n=1 Tax=uncultured Rubrobacteraceae bacterium TaxID=349277 RepID=A0A6J4R3C2_9ACTN|nr:MAG: Transcriptional regulator, MerR family [uncultured Rubrobacteraceae bacterium]